MKKVVFTLILLLSVVIIAETFFYFRATQPQQTTLTPSVTIAPSTVNQRYTRNADEERMIDTFRINKSLEMHGILVSAKSDYTFRYEIVRIDVFSEPKYMADVNKNVKAIINYKTPNDTNGTTLTERDLSLIKFEDEKNPGTLNNLNDLKPGDTIQYHVIINPLKTLVDNTEQITITRL